MRNLWREVLPKGRSDRFIGIERPRPAGGRTVGLSGCGSPFVLALNAPNLPSFDAVYQRHVGVLDTLEKR